MRKYLIVAILTVGLALGSMAARAFDASPYHLIFGEARWHTKVNNFMDAMAAQATLVWSQMQALNTLVTNWVIVENQEVLHPAAATYGDADTFTVAGNYTTAFATGKEVKVRLAAGVLKGSSVASSSFGGGVTTVNLNDAILTDPISAVWYTASRDGLMPRPPGAVYAADYDNGNTSQAAIDGAVAAIGVLNRALVLSPGDWPVAKDFPANISVVMMPGARFTGTGTVSILGGLEAGREQIFAFTGAGQPKLGSKIPVVYPEWWGAVPDGVTDPGTGATTGTDSGAAIRAAVTCLNTGTGNDIAYKNVQFSDGTYLVLTGQILQDSSAYMQGQQITGAGMQITQRNRQGSDGLGYHTGTRIVFNDDTIDALWKIDTKDAYVAGWKLADLALQGPGVAAGTNIHGLFFTNSDSGAFFRSLYRSLLSNLSVSDVSGCGYRAYKFWTSRFDRISASNCGSHGIMMPGFTNTFDNCGQYNYNIGGASLWLMDNYPEVNTFSSALCDIGIKLGVDPTDAVSHGGTIPDAYWTTQGKAITEAIACYPTLNNINIEPCLTYGIFGNRYSNVVRGTNIYLLAHKTTAPDPPNIAPAAIKLVSPLRRNGEWRDLFINPGNAQGYFAYNWDISSGYYAARHAGSGLSDITVTGTYNEANNTPLFVKISTAGATDKFQWKHSSAGAWSAEIDMTGAAQLLDHGISITWGATTGHTLNDEWRIGGDDPPAGIMVYCPSDYYYRWDSTP